MKVEQAKKIGDLISSYIKEDGLESGIQTIKVFDAWEQALFQQTSSIMTFEQSKQLTINMFYKEKILTCQIGSSVIRNQLHFQQNVLKNRINEMLNGVYVEKIIIK